MQNSHGWTTVSLLLQNASSYILRCNRDCRSALAAQKVRLMSIKAFASRFNNWRRYRAAVRELSQLSDRELADLGLSRYDIDVVARRSANI